MISDPVEAWTQYVHGSLVTQLRSRLGVSRREIRSVPSFCISTALAVALAALGALLAPASPLLGCAALIALAALGFLFEAFREHVDECSGTNAAAARVELALSNGAPDAAAKIAGSAFASARSISSRRRLLKALAWAGVGRRDPIFARRALLKIQPSDIDVHLFASYLGVCDRVDDAIELLEEARRAGRWSAGMTVLLADLLVRRSQQESLGRLAGEPRIVKPLRGSSGPGVPRMHTPS